METSTNAPMIGIGEGRHGDRDRDRYRDRAMDWNRDRYGIGTG